MAVKNFVFKENWVDSKVAGLTIFDPNMTHNLASKSPNKEFLKEYFSQEKQKLYYYQFGEFKTD